MYNAYVSVAELNEYINILQVNGMLENAQKQNSITLSRRAQIIVKRMKTLLRRLDRERGDSDKIEYEGLRIF